jgi:hypothetical protein
MCEVIDGLVSGVIWSAILAPCLVAIVAVVAATVPARARMRSKAEGTTSALGISPISETVRRRRDSAVARGAAVRRVPAGSRRANRTGEAPSAVASPSRGSLLLADSRA